MGGGPLGVLLRSLLPTQTCPGWCRCQHPPLGPPHHAGLWGLARCVRAEHPELELLTVDIDAQGPAVATALAAELRGRVFEEPEVALRGQRFVPRLLPTTLQAHPLHFVQELSHLAPGSHFQRSFECCPFGELSVQVYETSVCSSLWLQMAFLFSCFLQMTLKVSLQKQIKLKNFEHYSPSSPPHCPNSRMRKFGTGPGKAINHPQKIRPQKV